MVATREENFETGYKIMYTTYKGMANNERKKFGLTRATVLGINSPAKRIKIVAINNCIVNISKSLEIYSAITGVSARAINKP